jgi:hypothetical protein
VNAHLATYSEFLQTVSSFPRGAAYRDMSHEVCLELQNQFEKLKSFDMPSLLAGLCRSGKHMHLLSFELAIIKRNGTNFRIGKNNTENMCVLSCCRIAITQV